MSVLSCLFIYVFALIATMMLVMSVMTFPTPTLNFANKM